MNPIKLDEQWFKDRIGKRIYRTEACKCEHCTEVYNKGLIITDMSHALYLYSVYHDFNADGDYIMYYDNLEDRELNELD